MSKTLEEQMYNALYKATVINDPPMLEAAIKVAQIYALEQQIELLKDIEKQTDPYYYDTEPKMTQFEAQLKALKNGKDY